MLEQWLFPKKMVLELQCSWAQQTMEECLEMEIHRNEMARRELSKLIYKMQNA